MKKLIALLVVTCLLLCGCQGKDEDKHPLKIAKDGTVTAQVNGETVVFQPWKEDGLPTSGNYYLTKDVALAAGVELTADLRLCLRGHDITVAEGQKFPSFITVPAGMELTLFDAGEDAGTIVAGRSINSKISTTSCVDVYGKLHFEGAKIDAESIQLDGFASGLCVYLREGAEMTMTAGVISGGTGWNGKDYTGEEEEYLGDGGSIYVSKGAVCQITGGTVQNGSAARGGNIFVAGDTEKPGKLTVTNAVITGGESLYNGGNIYVEGELEMTSATVTLGSSYGSAGNIFVSGKLWITDSIVSEGTCDLNKMQGRKGGNILVNGIDADFYITNSKILNGTGSIEDHGGNISVIGYCAKSFLIENTEITGGVGHRGGNFYIGHLKADIPEENLDFVLTNVKMSEGTCTYKGSNICLDGDPKGVYILLTLNQCELMEKEGSTASNLAVGAGAESISYCNVEINGGKVCNGSIAIYGESTVTVNGAEFPFDDPGGQGVLVKNP